MLFEYKFGDTLDLTTFRKQAARFFNSMQEVTFHINLPHYRMTVESANAPNSNSHILTSIISDVWRDADGDVIREQVIFPLLDTRFKTNKDIQAVFTVMDNYRGGFTSNDTEESANKLCMVIKLLYKFDHLKAFL